MGPLAGLTRGQHQSPGQAWWISIGNMGRASSLGISGLASVFLASTGGPSALCRGGLPWDLTPWPLPLVELVAPGCPSGVVPWPEKEVTLHLPHLFIYFKISFIYLSFAALGLCCCTPAL